MFAKSVAAGLAGSALFATVAFAQTPTTTTDRANTMTPARRLRRRILRSRATGAASKVVGLNVYNDENQSIGSINDLLTDKSGNIKAAVISVGGFLGVGAHLVAVPYDKVKFVNEPVAVHRRRQHGHPDIGRQPAVFDHDHGRCDHVRPAARRQSPIRGIRITRCITRPRMS